MSQVIENKKVVIVATDGFEQAELEQPLKVLREAGAAVDVVAPGHAAIQGFEHFDKGREVAVDKSIDEVSADDYDALVIPGGLFNPDALRRDTRVLDFVRAFFDAGKPVGAICHGPWVLINAGVVEGRTMTSVASIGKDLENAGVHWVDKEVVVDQTLVTSRTPDDLPAFCTTLVQAIAAHEGGRSAA